MLRSFVLRRVPSASDAEDIVHDVLLKGLAQGERVHGSRLAAWLYTATRRALVDRRRADARRARLQQGLAEESASSAGANEGELREIAQCMRPLLEELEPADREILERIEIEGAAQVDVARALALPFSTLKSRVQRARQRLRERFERCCALELDGRGLPIACVGRRRPCS